jgi:hypothetical protein
MKTAEGVGNNIFTDIFGGSLGKLGNAILKATAVSQMSATFKLQKAMGFPSLTKEEQDKYGKYIADNSRKYSDGDWKLKDFSRALGYDNWGEAQKDSQLKNNAGDYAGARSGKTLGYTPETYIGPDGKVVNAGKIDPNDIDPMTGKPRGFTYSNFSLSNVYTGNPLLSTNKIYTDKQRKSRDSDAGLSQVASVEQKIRDRLGRDPTEADIDAARAAGTNLLGEPLKASYSNDNDREGPGTQTYSTDSQTAIEQMKDQGTFNVGGRNKGGLATKTKTKKKTKAYKKGGLASKKK